MPHIVIDGQASEGMQAAIPALAAYLLGRVRRARQILQKDPDARAVIERITQMSAELETAIACGEIKLYPISSDDWLAYQQAPDSGYTTPGPATNRRKSV